MKVTLKEDWMGHPAGSIVTVAKSMAYQLEHRKVADILPDQPKFVVPGPKLDIVSSDDHDEDFGEDSGETGTGTDTDLSVDAASGEPDESFEEAE